MLKLLSILLAVTLVNCQIPNGIIWEQPHHIDHHSQQNPHVHHIEHAREAQQEEEVLGTPLIGLKLAKPFLFGVPGLRFSRLNMGHLGPFKYANSMLGAENPYAEQEYHQHHHHAEAQMASPQQHYHVGSSQPCNCPQTQLPQVLAAPMNAPPQSPMNQPIVQPQHIPPQQPMNLPVQPSHTEHRTFGSGSSEESSIEK